jgi:uncharacterized protein
MQVTTIEQVRDMARGAVFLGAGGGGDPYVGELFLLQQLEAGRKVNVIQASELKDDAFVLSIAGVGAPTVLVEHLVSENTLVNLLARSEKHYGRKVDALISAEIGGVNSMFPLALGARSGLPVVDADGMGRAFPHIEMTTFSVYGCKATPCLLMDDNGNSAFFETTTDRLAEDVIRGVVANLGAMAFASLYPMTGAQVKAHAVHGTIAQTLDIGRKIRAARNGTGDPVHALVAALQEPAKGRHARLLFDGKITDVTHETRDGWHWGHVTLNGGPGGRDTFTIDIQNEYLVARLNGKTVTIVPDLLAVLDRESAEPLTAEMLAYGQRVRIVGYAAAPIMRRPECLKVFGPRLFGIEEDFVPVETLVSG